MPGFVGPKGDREAVIRFKNPIDGVVTIPDLIKGDIVVANKELDDLIIARGDGTPTYNLTVVVDDMDMKVTHVIRGDDHINNTPRQMNILKALGAELPKYAHLPMILGSDGARLSKRHGAVSVMQFRDDGYLPDALLNYLVRLGWSHGDQEIFSIDEMVEHFDVGKCQCVGICIQHRKAVMAESSVHHEQRSGSCGASFKLAYGRTGHRSYRRSQSCRYGQGATGTLQNIG